MHILLEGVVPVELGCILHGLCIVEKCLELDTVNSEFTLLWGKITIDRGYKPVETASITEPTHTMLPSMTAVQYLSLLNFMPLAVGRYIHCGNKHWKFLLHLSHLVDLIFAPRFTPAMIEYMKDVICDHLSLFLTLYGSDAVKLRPKHHLLVHLPSVIMKSGPLTGMNCMRYELKNSLLKRCAHICFTLAHRHQQYALHAQLSNTHIRTGILVGKHRYQRTGTLEYQECLCELLNVDNSQT